jgi:hypothetical protein
MFVSTVVLCGIVGCSVTTETKPNSSAGTPATPVSKARPKATPKIDALKDTAGAKPPAGARAEGKKTRPKAGTIEVPIEDVDVYTFRLDVDGSGVERDVEWAHPDGGSTYLWARMPVECAAGPHNGDGFFLMEVQADGSGTYLYSIEGCPSSDLFGCDFDANGDDTTCGLCSTDGVELVCSVTS